MENLQIVQIGDRWVVAVKNSCCQPGQRKILSASKSREEALENALIHAIDIQNKFEECLYSIAECLNTDINMEGLGQEVEIPGVYLETDGGMEKDVSSIGWDEELKKWCWFFD